jgi:hypothetical protein
LEQQKYDLQYMYVKIGLKTIYLDANNPISNSEFVYSAQVNVLTHEKCIFSSKPILT